MPKLIVYVKADTWRRIEAAANGEDAAALARRISVQAIEDFLSSEGAVGDPAESSSARDSVKGQAGATAPKPPRLERAPSEDPHFKPDFK
jgi:hypothetical protein